MSRKNAGIFIIQGHQWESRVAGFPIEEGGEGEQNARRLDDLEMMLGLDLPPEYRHFAPKIQGAAPRDPYFGYWGRVGNKGVCRRRARIERFLLADPYCAPWHYGDSVRCRHEFIREFDANMVPIAIESDGGLVCLRYEHPADESPWVVLLRLDDRGEAGFFAVAPSFWSFINTITDAREYAMMPDQFEDFIALTVAMSEPVAAAE